MFTTVSTSYVSNDKIVEIKYDFISSESGIAFSMGDITFEEITVEDYLTGEKNKEGKKN